MASKWNGKPCPLYGVGTLRDGRQPQRLEYRGRIYEFKAKGAYCNHCHDGFPEYDERGQAKPVAAVINLFRLLDKHPQLLKELQADSA